MLRAADILLRRRVVELTLLGPEAEVRGAAGRLGLDLYGRARARPGRSRAGRALRGEYAARRAHKGVTVDQARDVVSDVSYFGTMMVALGMVDGMVSGATHTTAETIRPAFELVKTRPASRSCSSVFLMCLADRVLVYGDCAVNPHPTAEQLADIAISSAETAAQFGIEPRVAMLSYSTGASGSGAEVERVREATEIVRAREPGCPSRGRSSTTPRSTPAWPDEAARTATVAGRATVFIFPDLNTGNNTYKAVQRSANAIAIGPVLQGLNKPVNDLSRGATVHDIVNTVAITAIQAQSVFVVNCGSSSLKWSVVDADCGRDARLGHGADGRPTTPRRSRGPGGAPLDAVDRGRAPRRARRRALLRAGADQRRGAGRDPRPGGARAAAQPGQRATGSRSRGARSRRCRTSPSSTPPSTPRCRRARTPTPSRARGACAATASTARRTPTSRARRRACSAATTLNVIVLHLGNGASASRGRARGAASTPRWG